MSRPAESELDLLNRVALRLQEEFGARGHEIDEALQRDSSFRRSARARSALTRCVVVDAINVACSQAGIGFRPLGSDFCEIRGDRHVYRVLQARRTGTGATRIPVSPNSALTHREDEGFFPMEPWVFGFIPGELEMEEIFVARIAGVRGSNPGLLMLDGRVDLGLTDPDPFGGFTPSEEGLDIGDEEVGDEGAA